MTPWIADRVKARLAYFSLDPQNERFKTHVAAGGLGAVMDRHDTLCLYRSTLRIPLVHARQIPITFDGKARFNIANALAASLAAFAAGIEMDDIRGGPDDVPPDAVPGAGPRQPLRVPRLPRDDRLLPQRPRHGAWWRRSSRR